MNMREEVNWMEEIASESELTLRAMTNSCQTKAQMIEAFCNADTVARLKPMIDKGKIFVPTLENFL